MSDMALDAGLSLTESASIGGLVDLAAVPRAPWVSLAETAADANIFLDPDYLTYAARLSAAPVRALTASVDGRLSGLLPVVSAWAALRLPVPALVAHIPYVPLTNPLLSKDNPEHAAEALLDAAAAAGARLLVLPAMPLTGAVADAFKAVLAHRGQSAWCGPTHERAVFNATQDAETYLHDSMGRKKLKELRRQRHRLEDDGAVTLRVTSDGGIDAAIDRFLDLEAAGWKGQKGSALGQSKADATFIHRAAKALAVRGRCEIVELVVGDRMIASSLVMRQAGKGFFFKIAYDETLSKLSPGVQLTLDITRRFAEDADIVVADSTADADHPMIDHIWRERLMVGDLLVPTRAGDPLAAPMARLVLMRTQARTLAKRLYKTVTERRR